MKTTFLVAQVMGVLYFSFGIGLLFNRQHYKKVFEDLMTNSSFLILGGLVGIVLGCILLYTPSFDSIGEILVHILGWISLIKGVALLAAPRLLKPSIKFFTSTIFLNAVTPLSLILGGICIYYGFLAAPH